MGLLGARVDQLDQKNQVLREGMSGYLLPWNQLAFFATKVGTDITGAVPLVGPFLLRFLRANWLALDAQLLDQGRISHYRLLEADVGKGLDDSKAWDYAVILEYRDRQAMDEFVPAYLELIRTRPQVRIDGLVFADLGEVVQQKITQPLDTRLE